MVRRQRLELIHQSSEFNAAFRVVEALQAAGHEAVFAGGSVRDALLGRMARDLDIATSALPEQVEDLFPKTLAVGKIFGTIVVLAGESSFEVTTFRQDGDYQDGRHPLSVEFADMHEDARRRDFTVNALFYDPKSEKLYDLVSGIKDLDGRILRAVGEAKLRFQEDRLRMLRAVRFQSQLGFAIEDLTFEAIKSQSQEISAVSGERILNEMIKLLSGVEVVPALVTLQVTGLAKQVWPEMAGVDLSPLALFLPFLSWENGFAATSILAQQNTVVDRLRKWKASRESLQRVQKQIAGVQVLLNENSTRAERILALGEDQFAEILSLAKGLCHGDLGRIEAWTAEYLNVVGGDGKLPAPLLNGHDMISAGVEVGKKMGSLLKAHYLEQLNGRLHTKQEALAWLLNQI